MVRATCSKRKQLDDLKERAHKRKQNYSINPKTSDEVKVENDFFKIVENQVYAQIMRK